MKDLHLGFDDKTTHVSFQTPAGSPPFWDLDTDLAVVGKDHPRVDALLKVTGRAKYGYDAHPAGLIFAAMVRSPYAHAKVKRVDLTKAKALQGVLYTESYEGSEISHAGQRVAGLAATSEEILDDALALVAVEYEVLPAVVTVEAARKPGATEVKRGGNVVQRRRGRTDAARMAKVHGEADVVVESEYETQVQTHSCLETHGCVCEWKNGELTVWASTQGTFSVRGDMAQTLSIPESKVTVITEHMGGGFGSKFGTSAWDAFCARAARATKRPVRFFLDRRAEHLVAGNRPSSLQKCKFSAKKDGTLMGAEVHAWGTGGIAGNASVTNPAIYSFAAELSEQYDVFTHAGGARAFRAPGHPQGIFALEGMLDELADALGMDPLALRKKNDRHPVRQSQYDVGAKAIGWERRRKKPGSDPGPIKRGLGMASALWGHTGRPRSAVRCRIAQDGSVLVANGAQDIGTGTRTVIALVAAEELGLAPESIEVRLGNTDDPYGPPSGGSTTASSLGPAVRKATWRAKNDLLAAVAKHLGADAGDLVLKGGFVEKGGAKKMSFRDACALLDGGAIDRTERTTLEDYSAPRFAPTVAGVQFAEVEVDTETGLISVLKVVAVQDCGRVIDPMLARSQINGGVIQGISYALFEDRLLDPNSGDMVNPDLLFYKIAGSMEVPEIEVIPFPVANGINSLSMSSLGEPPTIPTSGAVANAVANALGVRVRSLPMTPDKVLAALGSLS